MEKPKAINYIPGSMSFSMGFLGPLKDIGYIMKYDSEKAKSIINELIISGAKITEAIAGLDGDFRENNSTVYDESGFHDYSAYELSCWAEPILIINFSDRPSETYSVWKREEKEL